MKRSAGRGYDPTELSRAASGCPFSVLGHSLVSVSCAFLRAPSWRCCELGERQRDPLCFFVSLLVSKSIRTALWLALSGPPSLLLTSTSSEPGPATEAGRSREGWTEGARRWRQRHARADPRRRDQDSSCGASEGTGQGQGKGDAGTGWDAWEGGDSVRDIHITSFVLGWTPVLFRLSLSVPGQASNLSLFQASPERFVSVS
jgi:hypothetical protein